LCTYGKTILSFDIGGGHITAGVPGTDQLSPVKLIRSAISDCREEPEFMARCRALGDELLGSIQIDGVSLAFPGPFDYESGVSRMKHKLVYLYGLPLRRRLAAALGCPQSSVFFCNDTDAFLQGELAQLVDSGERSVGVTLGTGIGSAFAVNGNISTEGDGIPRDGEIWNLPWNGGILEDAVSGARILEAFRAKNGNRCEEVIDVALAARGGKVDARSAFAVYGRLVGAALAETFKRFRPSTIFLGGGISKAAEFFLPSLMESLDSLQTRVVVSSNSEASAVLGASLRWVDCEQSDDREYGCS
jgi:predicted NBD/HSP70 family sugar kinase